MSFELIRSWCAAAPRQQRSSRPCPPLNVLAPAQAAEQTRTNSEAVRAARLLTAIKTPYLPSGKFDLTAYDRLVDIQASNGVEGLIVGGTTGEGHLMSWDEHIMLIAHTVNAFGRRLVVVGNTGSNSTREALHATEQGFAVGMHAALQINPYYGKTSRPGLVQHFEAVLAEGPGILYNVPGRTGQDIPDGVVDSVAGSPGFLGVKECTGNARIRGHGERGVRTWSGNDDEAHQARHEAGAQGVISVTSNLVPGLFAELMRAPNPELARSAEELIAWLFQEPNPTGVNTALAMCGLAQPVFRLPYVPLPRQQREEGVRILTALRDWLPGVEDIKPLEDSDFTVLSHF